MITNSYKSVHINTGTPARSIYWYALILIVIYMTPMAMGVYSIYMGVRYIGINGVYHIYHSTLLCVFPDVVRANAVARLFAAIVVCLEVIQNIRMNQFIASNW
jgi:hypothetical protein